MKLIPALHHSGEGLGSQKYWMYLWRISKMKAGIVENNLCNQPLVKTFEPHMSFSVVPINTDKEIGNK